MNGWVRASKGAPEKVRMNGLLDSSKHPELALTLANAPFRSCTQLMIDLIEDGLRWRGIEVGGVGTEGTAASIVQVKRGRGCPVTRRLDNPVPAITQGLRASVQVAPVPAPSPTASRLPAAMQEAEPLSEQKPPRVAADAGFVLEPSPSSMDTKPGRTSPRGGMANEGPAAVEDGKPSQGLSRAAASLLDSMLNLLQLSAD